MKFIRKSALGLAVALSASLSSVAVAQEREWNSEQTEVWGVVAQSWVDDAAENGNWPGEYLHEDALGFSAEWPAPRRAESIVEWSRFGDGRSQTLKYELFPMAISVSGDTAVVQYSVVSMDQEGDSEAKRTVGYTNETLVRVDGEWKFLSLSGWDAE